MVVKIRICLLLNYKIISSCIFTIIYFEYLKYKFLHFANDYIFSVAEQTNHFAFLRVETPQGSFCIHNSFCNF